MGPLVPPSYRHDLYCIGSRAPNTSTTYVEAVHWAQDYALLNRQLMMQNIIAAVRNCGLLPLFGSTLEAVNCHHNYVTWEHQDVRTS